MKFNIYLKKVDATVHTMEAKVKAVVDAPTPTAPSQSLHINGTFTLSAEE